MTPLEKAADSVIAEIERQTDGAWPCDYSSDGRVALVDAHLDFTGIARAVLQAIREPSEGMLAAAKPEPTHLYGKSNRGEDYQRQMKAAVQADRMVVRQDWEAMIDQALSEAA